MPACPYPCGQWLEVCWQCGGPLEHHYASATARINAFEWCGTCWHAAWCDCEMCATFYTLRNLW